MGLEKLTLQKYIDCNLEHLVQPIILYYRIYIVIIIVVKGKSVSMDTIYSCLHLFFSVANTCMTLNTLHFLIFSNSHLDEEI